MAYATDTARGGQSFGQRLGTFRTSIGERFARYRVYRQTMTELDSLNDRELADLGISRFDIGRIAAESAYGTR